MILLAECTEPWDLSLRARRRRADGVESGFVSRSDLRLQRLEWGALRKLLKSHDRHSVGATSAVEPYDLVASALSSGGIVFRHLVILAEVTRR